MALHHLSPAPCATAHPQASAGYGKRSAPDQLPRTARDFLHLSPRVASVAAYIDQCADGADISIKTLAKVLPDFGQCALGTIRRRLSEAGMLRCGRQCVTVDGQSRWVTYTYFSRTPRDEQWWAAFLRGEHPDEPPRCEDEPQVRAPAYDLLATLGRTEPRMTLSAADCASLTPLAARWLERGASGAQVTAALTEGLPLSISSPSGLARKRLTDRLPPQLPAPRRTLRMLECTVCRAPGRPESLPGGICGACRGHEPPEQDRAAPDLVRDRVNALRAAARARPATSGNAVRP
ncbi:hypothetical protein [Streptomyces sp. ODS28]|uniref:hypothetical protein n=1 Tax=Streptomyces sp. ODS28 TaxID=3136688 RepID=UPI0031EC8185